MIFLGRGEQFAAMCQGGSATSLLEAELDLGRVDPVLGSHAQRMDATRGQQSIKITRAPACHNGTVGDVCQQ